MSMKHSTISYSLSVFVLCYFLYKLHSIQRYFQKNRCSYPATQKEGNAMIIEVQKEYAKQDEDWEVNVWDEEDNERLEDLERTFPTEEEADEYVLSLVKDKQYVVKHI